VPIKLGVFENEFLFDHFLEGIYFVDRFRKILFFNLAAETITGFSAKEVVNASCFNNLFNHMSEEGIKLCFNGCPLQKTILTNTVIASTVYLQHRDGHRLKVKVKTLPVVEEGEVIGALEVFSPVVEEHLLQETIAFYKNKMMTDPLTQLNNRQILEKDIPETIRQSKSVTSFGVIFIDIDNFKKINDTYGHEIGDKVLIILSKTLANSVRKDDILIRYGGEEFVIILSDVNPKSLALISEKVRFMVESSSLREGVENLKFTISIGATLLKSNDSLNSAIERADQAMYQSKKIGKNCVTLSIPSSTEID